VKLRLAELLAKQRQVPRAIQAYREVADSYTQEGFYLKAVTVLKSILRLNPSLLDVNRSLAGLYEKMGLSKDASHQYEILASAFEQSGKFEESLLMREKLVNLFPKKPDYRVRLAEAYQREEKKEEAIEQFEILAKQYEKEKTEPGRLIDLYEKILPHRSENKEMFTALVDLYFQKKDFRSACKWLEQKKGWVEDDPHLLGLQAEMYGKLNQSESARAKYQQLAGLYAQKGEIDQALKCYEEILALLPEEAGTVKEEVERLQAGAFEALVKRAGEKRVGREAAEEADRAKPPPEEKPTAEKPKAEKPKAEKPKAAPRATPKTSPKAAPNIETLLKAARSSISLFQAYQAAGLKEEAAAESAHAQEALKKILAADANHAEAKRLLAEMKG
ncbi:MAG: tetratricopeptide repeat protein, partial [Deltaproteobacteria bacterium]|nr:tetratricopeptide repeat protein [Deltaproteobacteria bacterium]